VRAGKIKAYAVTAKTRLSSAPNIPTVAEAGVPQLGMSIWSALWAKDASHGLQGTKANP
jgi:tripartite-type tricarboxylate transporter receptor subunit TctC